MLRVFPLQTPDMAQRVWEELSLLDVFAFKSPVYCYAKITVLCNIAIRKSLVVVLCGNDANLIV